MTKARTAIVMTVGALLLLAGCTTKGDAYEAACSDLLTTQNSFMDLRSGSVTEAQVEAHWEEVVTDLAELDPDQKFRAAVDTVDAQEQLYDLDVLLLQEDHCRAFDN